MIITPTRATYRDVSLKVFKTYPIEQWKHCCDDCAAKTPVSHTCTGIERDARESFELGRAFPEAIVYIQDHQAGGGADEYIIGQLSIVLRLATIYEAKSLAGSGWPIGTKGRYYQKDGHIVAAIQGAIRAAGCNGCPQGLRDMADLDAKCKPGATGFVAPPLAQFDNAAGDIGEIKTRARMLPLTTRQRQLLHATHAAHSAHAGVFDAHLAFEASATTIQQSAFFKMRDFWGHWNKTWKPDERAQIDLIQDVMHGRWADCVDAGDWEHARLAANDHLQAHLLANIGRTPRMLYRFSRATLLHNAWPAQTWNDVLNDKTLLAA